MPEPLRLAPAEWQRELEQLTGPRSDRFSWLHLYWWEGVPWQVIQRWSIWEMLPPGFLNADPRHAEQFAPVLEALQGKPPREFRVFDGAGRFVRSDALVTQDQWDLYQQTGCFGRPFWVIQGEQGGHKFQFNHQEGALLRLAGLESAPPAPGDLPYADWDSRVRDQLAEQRALYESSQSGVPVGASRHEAFLVSRKNREQWFRTQLLEWLRPQVRQQVEQYDSVIKAIDLPVGKEITDEELGEADQSFITETAHD